MTSQAYKNFIFSENNLLKIISGISIMMYFANFFTFLSGTINIFNSYDTLNLNMSLDSVIFFFRSNYSVITLFINSIFFLIIFRENNYYNYFLFTILSLLYIPQIFGFISNTFFYNSYNVQSFTTLLFTFSAILNIINIFSLPKYKFTKLIMFIPIFALIFQFVIYFSKYSIWEIQYGGFTFNIKLFNKVYEVYFNSNGLGRTATIFYAFSIFYLFSVKSKAKIILFYSISFILSFFILSLAGRFNTLGLIFLNIFVIIFNFQKIKNNWHITLLSILILIFLVNGYKELQRERLYEENIKLKKTEDISSIIKAHKTNNSIIRQTPSNVMNTELERYISNNIFLQEEEVIDKSNIYKIYSKLNNLSTGRLSKWFFIATTNNRYLFGFGPNMDRVFFEKSIIKVIDKKPIDLIGANDSASGIMYQYISSGLIGIVGLVIFLIITFFNIIKNFKTYKSTIDRIYIAIFFLITFRVIFENGYIIYGIDFLVFLIAISNIYQKKLN